MKGTGDYMYNKTDFGKNFTSEEDIEAALEELLKNGSDAPADDKLIFTYKLLKYLAKKTKAKVTYEIDDDVKGMGSVSMIGKKLRFKNADAKWFIKAAELAVGLEVYPKTDGAVELCYTFYNLTNKIN